MILGQKETEPDIPSTGAEEKEEKNAGKRGAPGVGGEAFHEMSL